MSRKGHIRIWFFCVCEVPVEQAGTMSDFFAMQKCLTADSEFAFSNAPGKAIFSMSQIFLLFQETVQTRSGCSVAS